MLGGLPSFSFKQSNLSEVNTSCLLFTLGAGSFMGDFVGKVGRIDDARCRSVTRGITGVESMAVSPPRSVASQGSSAAVLESTRDKDVPFSVTSTSDELLIEIVFDPVVEKDPRACLGKGCGGGDIERSLLELRLGLVTDAGESVSVSPGLIVDSLRAV